MAKAHLRMFQNKKLKFFIIGTKVDCSNSHSLRSFGRLRGVSKIIYQNLMTILQNRIFGWLLFKNKKLVTEVNKEKIKKLAHEKIDDFAAQTRDSIASSAYDSLLLKYNTPRSLCAGANSGLSSTTFFKIFSALSMSSVLTHKCANS